MKISIIIPVYNKIKYISTVLQQVKAQSFVDFECLLIDDGSTDGSDVVCDEYATEDSRFKVFHITNGGVSNARNVGLKNAIGKYITFIDSDDEILPNYLENLYNCIIDSDADIVISGYTKFWDDNRNVVYVHHPYKCGMFELDECIHEFAEIQNETGLFGCCVSKIFKRILCYNTTFDTKISLAEDFDFYLKLYNKARTLYFDDKCLYLYRQAALNSSALIEDGDIDYLSQLQINLRYKAFLKKRGAYKGTNKEIVEQRISNYIFFSLFYCPKGLMNVRIVTIEKIQKSHQITSICGNRFQKTILLLLRSRFYTVAKFLILGYRWLKAKIKKA